MLLRMEAVLFPETLPVIIISFSMVFAGHNLCKLVHSVCILGFSLYLLFSFIFPIPKTILTGQIIPFSCYQLISHFVSPAGMTVSPS